MNKADLLEIKKIATEASDAAAVKAVAQMREFHQDDLKVLRERMDMGFEAVDHRFDAVDIRMDKMDERFDRMDQRFDRMDGRFDKMDQRFDQVENVLATLLKEFKQNQEDVAELKKENQKLTLRVQALERELATMK